METNRFPNQSQRGVHERYQLRIVALRDPLGKRGVNRLTYWLLSPRSLHYSSQEPAEGIGGESSSIEIIRSTVGGAEVDSLIKQTSLVEDGRLRMASFYSMSLCFKFNLTKPLRQASLRVICSRPFLTGQCLSAASQSTSQG